MRLERLKDLHADMLRQGMTRTKFDFVFRNLSFSVIYIADKFPHELLFGCRAHDIFFVVSVNSNYEIKPYIGDCYSSLVKALGLEYDPNNKFKPSVLFDDFAQKIPLKTSPANAPSIIDIAANSKDVEESTKIYFVEWKVRDGIKMSVTPKNLSKTKRICGVDAHEFCKRHNISSCWTDDKSKAKQYRAPAI